MSEEMSCGDVAADFRSALKRLKDGKPEHEELKERLANDKLRINIRSVALEAGHSRTLIGHDGCLYPDERKLVLDAVIGDPAKRKETLRQEILRLRNEVSELKDTLYLVVTANAELVLRVRQASQGLQGDGRPQKRASKKARLSALKVIDAAPGAANRDD